MLKGFDISAYQGNVVPPCDFVFVKATEGASYVSTRFAAQWASAAKNAKVRGAYHFARPEQSSALAQADRLIATAKPQPGDMLCLDLEASGLNQSATNAWARTFGQRLRERAPGIRTVLYIGSGYASNGTGRGLSAYYDLWWYPQYPSTARTSTWPTSFSPWLPSGLTCGWSKPHIWQFTDNFGGLDASVTALTIDQLAGSGGPSQEDDVANVVSADANGKTAQAQEVPANGDASIYWGTQYSDKNNLFQPDKNGGAYSLVILDKAAGSLWAQPSALFRIEGLQPGDSVDVSWDRMKPPAKDGDPWQVSDNAWRRPFTADAKGVIHDELGGQFSLDSTVRLRLRVYNPNAYPVRLTSAMAKVTLLKY